MQAIYTIKPEMLKWSPEANQLKLGIRRVKQWWETWWNERFSKSTVYTMGVKACTQQMSWGNIKHFFFPSQKQTVFPRKCHFFFLFSQSGHENWVSGSFKCPNPKISLAKMNLCTCSKCIAAIFSIWQILPL